MNKEVKLAICRGLPGQGKSTIAKYFAKKYNLEHFENDAYLYVDGKYVWTPDAASMAAKKCFDDTMSALKAGKSVVVSNTFITKRAVDRYVKAAKRLNVKVAIFRATGNFQNIHDVPADTLANMKANFQDYPGEVLVKPEQIPT